MVLGEEFQIIPGHVHKRFMFGLRNVNIEETLANRTMLISSLGLGLAEATVTVSSHDSPEGRTVSLGSELSFSTK